MNFHDDIAAIQMPVLHHFFGETGNVKFVSRAGVESAAVNAILGDVRQEVNASQGSEFEADYVVERRAIRVATVALDLYSGVKIGADTNLWAIESVSDQQTYEMTIQLVRETLARSKRAGLNVKVS